MELFDQNIEVNQILLHTLHNEISLNHLLLPLCIDYQTLYVFCIQGDYRQVCSVYILVLNKDICSSTLYVTHSKRQHQPFFNRQSLTWQKKCKAT